MLYRILSCSVRYTCGLHFKWVIAAVFTATTALCMQAHLTLQRSSDMNSRHPKRWIFLCHGVLYQSSPHTKVRQHVENILVCLQSSLLSMVKPAPPQWTLSWQVSTVHWVLEKFCPVCTLNRRNRSHSLWMTSQSCLWTMGDWQQASCCGILQVGLPVMSDHSRHVTAKPPSPYQKWNCFFKAEVIKMYSVTSQAPWHSF